MNDVKIIKFLNGEEVVCECITKEGDEDNYYVAKCMQVVPLDAKGKVTIVPWAPLVKSGEGKNDDDYIKITKNMIVFCESVNENTEKGHREFFSDIITPEKGSIIT